jgi:hypothetical protein
MQLHAPLCGFAPIGTSDAINSICRAQGGAADLAARYAYLKKMTDIEKLIEADETNCEQSKKVFNQFDPLLTDSFNDAANLFTAFLRSFGHGATDDDTQHEISELAKEAGVTESEIKQAKNGIKPSTMGNNLFKKIVSKKYNYYSRRSRALLLLQAYRSYMYAATDMRRFRVGTATGFMRLEIEAVALMYLFHNNASLAYTWFNLRGDSQGKDFYNKTKRKVWEFCNTFNLTRLSKKQFPIQYS